MATYLVFPDDREQGVPRFFHSKAKARAHARELALQRNLNVRVWKENLKTGLMTRVDTVRPAYVRSKNPGLGWIKAKAIRIIRDNKGRAIKLQVRTDRVRRSNSSKAAKSLARFERKWGWRKKKGTSAQHLYRSLSSMRRGRTKKAPGYR